MKFSVARDNLLKPLNLVAGVVERRQTLPVLSNVLIQLNGTQLSLTGTDLEVELVGRLNLDKPADVDGEITLPARKLVDICKSLPEGAELNFELDEHKVIIQAGRSKFSLSTLPATEFPNIELDDTELSFELEQAQLKELIDKNKHKPIICKINNNWSIAPKGLGNAIRVGGTTYKYQVWVGIDENL